MSDQHSDRVTGTLESIGRADHTETSEYRIFGPPGTGKTTNLTRQIHRAVAKFGADSILVTSFSRAAAAELIGRDLPVSRDRVGTLHSHSWHVLGRPEIAEANVEEWNRDHPSLTITPQKNRNRLDGEESAGEDEADVAKSGDELLQQVNRFRGLQLPEYAWPQLARQFAAIWAEYKQQNGLLDFTDLIETCLHDVFTAPMNPSVIFTDEAQDLNPMQLSLIRKWGERAEYFIICGDDDQAIFSFTGASPEAMLDPDIPTDHKIILKQSFRVPRAVHALSEKLIRRVTRRQEKEYLPRDDDGRVEWLARDGFKHPEIAIVADAEKHIGQGKTVMFLATCSYMLRPLIAALRNAGIPFHNPYRKTNGAWNPLSLSRKGSTSGRVLALAAGVPDSEEYRPWTNGDVAQWAQALQSRGILQYGAKKKLATFAPETPAAFGAEGIFGQCFEPLALESLAQAWDRGYRALVEWWAERVTAEIRQWATFPVEVVKRHGPRGLVETPQVVVGTIHSVKGGQADVVYLYPDLSQAGAEQYARPGISRDAVIRVAYVGATRARERLVICNPESAMAVVDLIGAAI